jgi:hypothetical protein
LFNQSMPETTPGHAASDYRLAPAFGARLTGGLLVLVAVLLLLATLVVGWLDLPLAVLLGLGLAGVLLVATTYVVTRRLAVVHLGSDGYRVRLVRGVGVAEATWKQVEEAVTASPGGVPVVVLRLGDGRSTTIPVSVLACDREDFVRDLRGHLQRGQGLRPL